MPKFLAAVRKSDGAIIVKRNKASVVAWIGNPEKYMNLFAVDAKTKPDAERIAGAVIAEKRRIEEKASRGVKVGGGVASG